ncbi:MAG: PEP/pyruvate-binding domain-containing protein, partial [Planctomycetota bacterium]
MSIPISEYFTESVSADRHQGFEHLMPYRIREVLLVSSLYDLFILEQDGHIAERLLREYSALNLNYAPRLTRFSTGEEAIESLAGGRRFDLVICTPHLGGMDPVHFARKVKAWIGPQPVVLLVYDQQQLESLLTNHPEARSPDGLDQILLWTGDARILLATVNLIEDQVNADHDVNNVGVEVIVFVEDSIRFASSYLPTLYTYLMRQSQSLISEAHSMPHKMLRMRARPKVIWAHTYDEACAVFERYGKNCLGVISDVRFPRGGEVDAEAGFKLLRYVRERDDDLPILLQSHEFSNIERAVELDAAFVYKDSHVINEEVDRFMREYFGFGPFIFRTPDGREVARANDLNEFRSVLPHVPADSIAYHAEQNHFSKWLKARTEFRLANLFRSRHLEDFGSLEELRDFMLRAVRESQIRASHFVIADFNPSTFDRTTDFARIGGGSIGGKARGLAFVNILLSTKLDFDRFPGLEIRVPPTVVLGTDLFEQFLDLNHLKELVLSDAPEEEVLQAFIRGMLPEPLMYDLNALLDIMPGPMAVRSSSMLEDSVEQPFAGVYDTFMLPNHTPDRHARLDDLCTAIKCVYASAFSNRAKRYLLAAPQRPEMEKMAVIIQRLVGRPYGNRFYPNFAGVARSYNYYASGRMKPEDGVAFVALGLGKTVVEGKRSLRFCPRYPKRLPQFSTVDDTLRNAQRSFYALELRTPTGIGPDRFDLSSFPVLDAEPDGTLAPVASTWSPENDSITEGVGRPGTRIVTFASVLRHSHYPLAEVLQEMLRVGSEGMSCPVEIEFAGNFAEDRHGRAEFACLQMRPLAVMREAVNIEPHLQDESNIAISCPKALGN